MWHPHPGHHLKQLTAPTPTLKRDPIGIRHRIYHRAFIALTGVGAGTITTPLLILFLGVPAPMAVATGLMFSAAVKLVLVPSQIARKRVSWRILGFMLLGGLPGVLIGSLVLRHLDVHGPQLLLNGLLGGVLVLTALWQLFSPSDPRAPKYLPKTASACSDSDVRCRH